MIYKSGVSIFVVGNALLVVSRDLRTQSKDMKPLFFLDVWKNLYGYGYLYLARPHWVQVISTLKYT